VLFEGGLFTSAATDAVVWALQGYALGLVAHSSLEVCARSFYAQQDTYTPLYVAVGAMSVNILASVLLRGPLGHGGLALGNSIGVSIEVIALLIIARRRLNGVDERRILKALAHFVAASIAMAAAIAVIQSIFSVMPLPDGFAVNERLRSAIAIGVPFALTAVIGLIVYVIVASALGSEEVRALPRMILRRRVVPSID
jgi:putative peptidoglycan lipid II flippase